MEAYLSKNRFFSMLKMYGILWLLAAIVAGVIVLGIYFFSSPDRTSVSVSVSFNYEGIERGLSPNGNRFDFESELTDDSVILAAGQSLGITFTDEEIARIQDSIKITGSVTASAIEDLTNYEQLYDGDEISLTSESLQKYYYPSQYSISLNYRKAGYSQSDGKLLLTAILNSYESYFMNYYGYNSEIEKTIQTIDYNEYDYPQAVDVLENSLISLRSYLSRLNGLDHIRFVSKTTGYSFPDLMDAIDTIRSEDFSWVRSYIDRNNMTKNKDELIIYYEYRLKGEQRSLRAQQERLETLNALIDSYVKTQAVILGIGRADRVDYADMDSSETSYSFTQDAYMYDHLINARINCQTAISSTEQTIAMYELRIYRLKNDITRGIASVVENNLQRVDDKIKVLVEDTHRTGIEFFETYRLYGAFQVMSDIKSGVSLGTMARDTILILAIVEAFLLGLYIMASIFGSFRVKYHGGVAAALRRNSKKRKHMNIKPAAEPQTENQEGLE